MKILSASARPPKSAVYSKGKRHADPPRRRRPEDRGVHRTGPPGRGVWGGRGARRRRGLHAGGDGRVRPRGPGPAAPRRGGLEVCRHLREQGVTVPILMLTAKDALDDKVEGLGSGADDYLTKPFAFEELLARIRALLRRSRTLPPPVLRVGDLVLDSASRTVTRGGRRIELTTREFQLLSLLMRHPGQVLSRTLLLSRIWGYDFDGHTNVVEAYIRLLRRKIDAGERVPLIHTVRGAGYVLRPPSP